MSHCRRPIIYLFALLFNLLLLGCSQDASQADPSLTVPPSAEQVLERAEIDQQVLANQLGVNDLQPVVLDGNPVNIELAPKQYADSNMLITLGAEVMSDNGEVYQVQWLQEDSDGPAIILDPQQPVTEVWVPSVTERTMLEFRLVAVDALGYLNSAVTQVVVLPLEQAPLVTASVSLQDNRLAVDVELSQSTGEGAELFYFTQSGTAVGGIDYEDAESALIFEPGQQSATVHIALPDAIREVGRYFYLHLGGVLEGQAFERVVVMPLPAQLVPSGATKPEVVQPTYEGPSDQTQEQLAGPQGPVRALLEWQQEGETLLQLRVTDPCEGELHLEHTEALCEDGRGYYDLSSEDPTTHNVVWLDGAPAGDYHIELEHIAGPGTEYQLRVFWGEESALYSGYIGPEQRITVTEFAVEPYDPWQDRVLPRPSQPNADLAAGAQHNLALDVDGGLWAWGDDSHEALAVPDDVAGVVAVAAGGTHSLALGLEGNVWAWGGNSYGQADVPVNLHDVVALSAGAQHSLALHSNGTLTVWGDNGRGQGEVPSGLRAVSIASGGYYNLALTDGGVVVAWGDAETGATAVPVDLPPITAIAAGAAHSLALGANGRVYAWGFDEFGQVSVPEDLDQVVAIAAGAYHSLALKADGTVVAWGDDSFGQAVVPDGLREVVSISAGAEHSVALTADGLAIAWGNNESEQVSVPDELAEQVRYESRKHMLLLALRGAEVSDIQVPVFGEDTGCSSIQIPEFVAEESGYAIAAATSVYLSSGGTTSFSVNGTLSALDPVVSDQSGSTGLRLLVAGGAVEPMDAVSGAFSLLPAVSEPYCMAGSFFVPGADYVSHSWSPTNTNHGLMEVSLSVPEDVLPGDLLVLLTMHRQEYADGVINKAVLTDSGYRKVGFGNVSALYVQSTTNVEEYQYITVWAKKASEVDAGRNLSIYSF